jgi:hypothetical protein
MNTSTVLLATFDQHHTTGTLKGMVTKGTLGFSGDRELDAWVTGVRKHAVRNGWDLVNVRVEVIPMAAYLARFGG